MISFIVIGRNEGERLEKCFKSILDVVEKDEIDKWELLYIDSKSSDDSLNIAKGLPNSRVFLITGECNAAIARNIGAMEAQGETLFFIDGDMEILPGFLPKVIDKTTSQLKYPFVSATFEDIVYNQDWTYLYSHKRLDLKTKKFESVVGGLFLIDRQLWMEVGGMDNRQKRSQDYDLGLRLSRKKTPLCRYPDLLAKHHMTQYVYRPDFTSMVKYTSLLLRKHWTNVEYLKVFTGQQYTAILLLLSVISAITINPWSLGIYIAGLTYKATSIKRKEKESSLIKNIPVICRRDFKLWWNLIFFHPTYPKCEYIEYYK